MSPAFFEMLVVFGFVFAAIFTITSAIVINSWIKRKHKNTDLSQNREFLEALREFKEKTDRRISALESIVADEHPKAPQKKELKSKQTSSIDIELEQEEKPSEGGTPGSNLRNMLNQ
ncbi:MAG: hypothetical protein ACNA78_08605 [Balneolaceae bacterium]